MNQPPVSPDPFRGSNKRKALRLAALAELLRDRPSSKNEILEHFAALELAVSKSSVERCIRDLYDLHLGLDALQESLTAPKRYFIPCQTRALPPVEALLTHSAVRLLYHHSPGYQGRYLAALEHLAAALPEPARSVSEKSTQDLRSRRGERVKVGEREIDLGRNLELVAQAWFERRILAFDYLSPSGSGAWRKKELQVYFIEISRANLEMYVIGFERSWHHQILTFKLNRMSSPLFMGSEAAYRVPDDFDPTHFLSSAWGVIGTSGGGLTTVKLRFSPEAAYRILEGAYPALEVERVEADGSLIAQLEVGSDNAGFPLELLSWVQSWGSRVEVLGPPELRVRWLEEARQVFERAIGGGHDGP